VEGAGALGIHSRESVGVTVPLSTRLTELSCEDRIPNQLKERLGKRLLAIHRNENSGLSGLNRLGYATNVGCNDRLPERHRLEQRHWNALGTARQAGGVGRTEQVGDVE